MTEFVENTLGEVCHDSGGVIQTGPFGSQLHQSDYSETGIPVVMPADIKHGRIDETRVARVSEGHVERLKRHKLEVGDIVYGRRGDIGRQAIIRPENEGWLCGTGCLRLSLGEDPRILPEYLHLYLSMPEVIGWIQNQAIGATMPNLNTQILKRVPLIFPEDLDAQKTIVAIVAAYDDLIENNKRRITLLENMAEEIYREWFVRFRFPGWQEAEFEKGKPRGWSYRRFRDLVTHYIGGGWGEDEQSAVFSEGAYVIRGTDIPKLSSGDFSPRIFRFHKPSNLKSRRMQEYDFVFEASGGSKDQLLGRNLMLTSGMLSVFSNEVMCASFCKHIRFDKEKMSPFFMKYFLKLFYEQDLVGIYQVQSTGISNYQFESFLDNQHVLVPDESILKSFDKVVKPFVLQLDNLALANLKLEQTKIQLLPRLISGKLSVENLDIQSPPSMQSDESGSADEAAA